MKIVSEISLENFEAWSGAKNTLQRIIDEGKCEDMEYILEDMYPEGMTATQLNDLLMFEEDTVYEWLDMDSKTTLEEKIEDVKDRIDYTQDLIEIEMDVEEDEEIDTEVIEELEDVLANLEDELSDLKDRYDNL